MTDELLQMMLETIGRHKSCATADDMFAAIGYGGIQLWKVLPRVRYEWLKMRKTAEVAMEASPAAPAPEKPAAPPRARKAASGVLIEGMDNCLVKFSRCCNPLPGDEIIGFITRGYGVSVHKRSCTNVPQDMAACQEPERWVSARWESDVQEEFKSTLEIMAADRSGLLADVTQQLFNMHLFIHSLNSRELKDGVAVINATITVNGRDHLEQVINRLKNVKSVQSVRRS